LVLSKCMNKMIWKGNNKVNEVIRL
jgi:hypothetical protein